MADLTHTSQGLPEARISLPYPQGSLHPSKPLCRWASLPNPQASQLGSGSGVLRFPRKPSLPAHLSRLEEAFVGLPWLPYPGPVPSACVSPITTAVILVWCQVCLPSELSVITMSPASPSLGLGTENINV